MKPSPSPAIHALPEYRAEGGLRADYDDTRAALQVPWMGVVAMAFAHYRRFYGVLWPALKPLMVSRPMIEACEELGACAERAALALSPPPLEGHLTKLGYAPRELGQIRDLIAVFSHGNLPYAVMATVTRLLLEGGALEGGAHAPVFDGRHAPDVSVPFLLVEPHHADAPTRAVYEDIKTRLGLPFVNTDYRALARWPSYFALAWGDLSGHVGSDAYEAVVATFHHELVGTVRRLPNPGGLDGAALCAAADADALPGEVPAMVRLFQWLLPGLIVNVAFFREQLREEAAA